LTGTARGGDQINAREELEGRRVVIEAVKPEVDGGRFAIKRTVGEKVVVEADIFADGHDALAGRLLYRKEGEAEWTEAVLEPLVNDRWQGEFPVLELGRYLYSLEAWIDAFETWRRFLGKKIEAGQDVSVDLMTGAELIRAAGRRARGADAQRLAEWADSLAGAKSLTRGAALALDEELARLVARHPDRRLAATYGRELVVVVERERARFSAWYEMFPRSCAAEPGQSGTFKDCQARLPYVARMGFDVLYLPPIHPIGLTKRKGPNNSPATAPDDPGSPWAIGAAEGGHTAIHPQLGDLDDFRRLRDRARELGLEIALDLAFQCTPDHPWVREHPDWFRRRPDGSIQYAENPPKKYEDIYPLDFDTEDRAGLWAELRSVVLFWIEQGIRIFRVDNPHTKPFAFWEWLIEGLKRDYPDLIFLAEAFTRPKVMYRLAKLGFSQSYTYFAWRNAKWELTRYFQDLTQTDVREFFRPNLWPNTPDILTEYLQTGGRPAFMARLVLSATLGASYGVYGPAFELCESRAREFGGEEYLDSEKYQIRSWDLGRPDSLKGFIARINRIRRENPALQSNQNLCFHEVDNDNLICYSKHTGDRSNVVLVVVNLDPHHTHAGWLDLNLEKLGLAAGPTFQVHDLLGDARFIWSGPRNYVELNPGLVPAHVFAVRKRLRTERDFDYYL